jgi:phosphoribosyl 1,2-cyclic phosphate phosphodiesterase
MKILFLGTSSGWPLPRLGCHCKICRSNDPKDKRWRSSLLINDSLLIDAGPDIYHEFLRLPRIPLIDHVLITHAHSDNTFGLLDLTHLYHPEKKYHRQKPLLLGAEKVLAEIKKQLHPFDFAFFPKKICQPFKKTNITKSLSVTFLPVEHSQIVSTFAIKILEKQQCVVYLPDFRAIPQSSRKYCQKADILILDGSSLSPAGPKRWGHMPIKKSIPLAKKLKAKQVYYTHIGHGPKSGTHQELETFVQKKGGKDFHIAYDFLKIEI